MQEFDITIFYKVGKYNVVADILFRLIVNTDNSPVEESFLDEHTFVVSSYTPWYADIANFLVARKLLHHISPRERWKIIQQSAKFS